MQKYNPELQKASIENRDRREKEYDDYVNKLKEWSKSDKSSESWGTHSVQELY